MARTFGATTVAADIRNAFKSAVRQLERKGKPLSKVILEQLESHPLETMRVVAGFVPKEMMIEATIHQELDELSDEALDREIGRLATEAGAVYGATGEEGQAKH